MVSTIKIDIKKGKFKDYSFYLYKHLLIEFVLKLINICSIKNILLCNQNDANLMSFY